jgi:hypothetical protein
MHSMDEMEYRQAVYEKADRFRSALEQGGLRLYTLTKFPHGSCGDTCEMLGQFLIDSGLGRWTYQSGVCFDPPVFTHAWLERDGLLLDITADQFDEISTPVLLTEDKGWHLKFVKHSSHGIASLEWFKSHDHPYGAEAEADYRVLKQRAET